MFNDCQYVNFPPKMKWIMSLMEQIIGNRMAFNNEKKTKPYGRLKWIPI